MSVGKKFLRISPKENWVNVLVSEVRWFPKEKGELPLLEQQQKR